MRDKNTRKQKCDGSIANESDCPNCGQPITAISTRGPQCHEASPCGCQVSAAYIGTPRVITDGGVPAAASILADLNDTTGKTERLRRYTAGELTRDDLDARDVTRPLQLAMGDLCLVVEFDAKTEYVWPTEDGWVAHTAHHHRQTNWGPIPLRLSEVKRRVLKLGGTLTIRASETVSFDPPEAALSEGVRA